MSWEGNFSAERMNTLTFFVSAHQSTRVKFCHKTNGGLRLMSVSFHCFISHAIITTGDDCDYANMNNAESADDDGVGHHELNFELKKKNDVNETRKIVRIWYSLWLWNDWESWWTKIFLICSWSELKLRHQVTFIRADCRRDWK